VNGLTDVVVSLIVLMVLIALIDLIDPTAPTALMIDVNYLTLICLEVPLGLDGSLVPLVPLVPGLSAPPSSPMPLVPGLSDPQGEPRALEIEEMHPTTSQQD
jgi:hypothetical protein